MFANRSPTFANGSLHSAPGNGFQEPETGGAETRELHASAPPETRKPEVPRAKSLKSALLSSDLCSIPRCGDTVDHHTARDALWATFFTEAPGRRRLSVARYSYVKKA